MKYFLFFVFFFLFSSEMSARENHVLCSVFLHLSHIPNVCALAVPSTHTNAVLCSVTWGILAVVMELWDSLIVTQDLYCGLQYYENVIQWSPILIKKCVLGCEFCSEGNNTLLFWKGVLLVSVRIIIQKWKRKKEQKGSPLVHHVPRYWSNVVLNAFSVIFQTFSNFKLESLPK